MCHGPAAEPLLLPASNVGDVRADQQLEHAERSWTGCKCSFNSQAYTAACSHSEGREDC